MGIGEASQVIVSARVMSCEQILADIRQQLNRWADESESEGWSTHQVNLQRKLAAEIQQFLDQK